MSKLPLVSARDLIKFLEKRGFTRRRQSGSHIIMSNGKLTFPVPNYSEIDRRLLTKILTEAEIDRDEFIQDWNKS